jgi:hypothetical protein
VTFLTHDILFTFHISSNYEEQVILKYVTFPTYGTSVSVFSSARSHATSERPVGATNTDDRGEYSSATRRTKENSRTTSNGPWSRATGKVLLHLKTEHPVHILDF